MLNEESRIVILTEDLDYGSTEGATADVYAGEPGNEARIGETITVHGWKLSPGQTVKKGTTVIAHQINGHWYAG